MSSGEADKCEGDETLIHVLIFPLPAQGHVNSMLQLAELLVLSGVHVSFVNTERNHARLMRLGDGEARFGRYPNLHMKTIPDDPRHGVDSLGRIFHLSISEAKPWLRQLCLQLQEEASSAIIPKLSCIIGDGILGSLVNELGNELGIPVIHFRTTAACCFWACFCGPNLLQQNELPIRGIYIHMDIIVCSCCVCN